MAATKMSALLHTAKSFMQLLQPNNIYLYRHIRPDNNTPFYIGIGKGRRCRYRTGRNEIWNRIVSKNNGIFIVEIILNNLSLKVAYQKEIEFIKIYGRIDNGTGILANMTMGGEGIRQISDLTKLKISMANTGKKRTEEFKKQRSELRKKFRHSAETKIKMSTSQLGSKNHRFGKAPSDKQKAAMSTRHSGERNANYKGVIAAVHPRTGLEIDRFLSPVEIRNFLGRPPGYNLNDMYAVINGRRKQAYGYTWVRIGV